MGFRLPSLEEKSSFVKQQFDRIAHRYDLTNDAISLGMHRWWKKSAVDALVFDQGGSYLDVCCGTGDLSLSIAGRLTATGQVTGLDFSSNMTKIANLKLKRAKPHLRARVSFVEGDAQNLPFPDRSFEGAVISFGLRNLTDLGRGLSEMSRVVKPGGRVVNLDLGHPTHPLFAPIFLFYFRRVVPLIGQLLQNDLSAYTYLPQSLSTYPQSSEISQMFHQAGLTEIEHFSLAMGSVSLHTGMVS